MKKLCFIALAVLAVSSCNHHYLSNSEDLYLGSRNGEKISVPSPLTHESISDFYDLPSQTQDPKVSINPPM